MQKALLLAHYGDSAEHERAVDMVNNHRLYNHFVVNTDHAVINLDVVRKRLPGADALIVLLSHHVVPGMDEWESARVEREAIEFAHKHNVVIGIIGRSRALMHPHILENVEMYRFVGVYCEPRDTTGGFTDTFPRADIIPVGDMNVGVRTFLARMRAQVVRAAA